MRPLCSDLAGVQGSEPLNRQAIVRKHCTTMDASDISPDTGLDVGNASLWTKEVASLPIAFAQVREDPRLDLEVIAGSGEGTTWVMIGSGGDSVANVIQLPLRRLHVVDVNPAQLALTRLKVRLREEMESTCSAVLGHAPMDSEARRCYLMEWFDHSRLDCQVLGPMDQLALVGPDHCGRYERLFEQLRFELSTVTHLMDVMLVRTDGRRGCLSLDEIEEVRRALWRGFEIVMSLPNLVALFGPDATQQPRQSFHRHFFERTWDALGRGDVAFNPFLWQMLAGRFPAEHPYDWHRLCGKTPTWGRAGAEPEIEYHQTNMASFLADLAPGSVDGIHLSNILDWLAPEEASEVLRLARRALSPSGWVLIRQLNSSLDISRLDSGFSWDTERGLAMVNCDRSFFYPNIFLGHNA